MKFSAGHVILMLASVAFSTKFNARINLRIVKKQTQIKIISLNILDFEHQQVRFQVQQYWEVFCTDLISSVLRNSDSAAIFASDGASWTR